MTASALAAGCLLVGLLLLAPAGGPRLRVPAPAAARQVRRPPAGGPLVVAAVGLGAVLLLGSGSIGRGAVGAAGLAALVVAAERSRARRRAEQARVRDRVDEGLAVLAAELAAGRSPPAGLAAAADVVPELAEAARLAALGADPVPALRVAALRPGAQPLGDLAAAWGLAVGTGAPMTPVVRRVRDAVAARAAADREAAEQLAPVHATGRVLAVLPVLGLGLSGAIGVDGLRLLTTTGWGQACLVLAVALVAAGLAWLDALTRAALR